MTDKQIREAVFRELDWEPQVKSTDIGVAVQEGVVTLSGFVDSYAQKHHAEQAAKRVFGVKGFANDLEVKLNKHGERPDPEIARAAISVLETRATLPADRIRVTVEKGWLTLEGQLDWEHDREAAEAAVRYLAGVKGISNLITLQSQVSPTDVMYEIEEALRRNAELDARRINVVTANSTVTLQGNVHSWSEKEAAEKAAWRAPGVTQVENCIAVVP